MPLSPGAHLGPYEILAPLGAGGMGEVYRARDARLGRDVAIKILPEDLAKDPERVGRFEQEARALAALSHPNILAVHDVGTAAVSASAGQPSVSFLVMELLDGETLRAKIESAAGRLPLRRALDYAQAMATGLAAAHAHSIVHRDLKPENVMVTRDGQVKLIDFGLTQVVHAPGLGPLDGGRGATPSGLGSLRIDDVADDGGAFIYRQSAAPRDAWLGSPASKQDGEVLRMQSSVDQVHLSPDGRWVAFNNADSGRMEVYVAPREMSGARWQVSADGGVQPIWRGDGKEIFYLDLDGTLQSVAIGTTDRAVAAGRPQALFKTPIEDANDGVEQYRATADGRRFLIKVPVGDQRPPALRVVLNWPAVIKK